MELLKFSEGFSADYYFSEKILKQLQLKPENHIFKVDSTNILQKIQAKKYDLVIIGTAHRHFNVFEKTAEQFNTSIIVHNLNFSKLTGKQLFGNIFKEDFAYRLKLFLKEGLMKSPKVYEKANHLLILDQSLTDVSTPEKYRFLPVFYTKFNEQSENEKLTVVVPGAVSQHRRDYNSILRKLKTFKTDISVVFLGKAKGEELEKLKIFDQEKPGNIQLKYFTEKIPQNEFDVWMKKADVLWCPIQKETEFFSNREVYGKTKMTGNIGDAIGYGKPSIFPKDYHSHFSFVVNEEPEIEYQLKTIKNRQFSLQFSKEKVAQNLEDTLKLLC